MERHQGDRRAGGIVEMQRLRHGLGLAQQGDALAVERQPVEAGTVLTGEALQAIEVIENGVDIEYFTPSKRGIDEKRIIFAGRLDQYSNRESILYFCNRIWPALKVASSAMCACRA